VECGEVKSRVYGLEVLTFWIPLKERRNETCKSSAFCSSTAQAFSVLLSAFRFSWILWPYDLNHRKAFSIMVSLTQTTKTMSTLHIQNEPADATVAQLAISHPAALSVFEKYNIDYCCGGHRTLEEACMRKGLNASKIRREISQPSSSEYTLRPEKWSSSLLVDFIIQNHHNYVADAIPEIKALLDKVCDAHGNDSLELLRIREDFVDLAEELSSHMQKEEFVLFPAIKRLDSQSSADHPLSGAIQSPISAMEHEHTVAGDLIKHIRTLSNDYTPPDFACPTFKITYQKLREFDNDLMRHIHLENNILFKRMKIEESENPFEMES
jgi:regulator of cell morphogenesis and NO signaling